MRGRRDVLNLTNYTFVVMTGIDIKQHIDFLANHSLDTLKHIKGDIDEELEQYLVLSLDRLCKASRSLSVLFNVYDQDKSLIFSIAVIYRAALLDSLLSAHLYIIDAEDLKEQSQEISREKLNEICKTYLADGVNRVLDIFKREQQLGLITNERLSQTFNKYVGMYPNYFKEYKYDGTEPEKLIKNFYTPKAIANKIFSSREFKNLQAIYGKYDLYSKFDHFSLIYYELGNADIKITNEGFFESTKHLILHSIIIHVFMKIVYNNDMYIEKQSKIISKYLEGIILE